MKALYIVFLFFFFLPALGQQTRVSGIVTDAENGEALPFVKVHFLDSKIGTFTDESGYYEISTYYATDTLLFSFSGYVTEKRFVQLETDQTIDVSLSFLSTDMEEVTVRPPDEYPSTTLHKKMVRNKPINDREKLESYDYEVYNKIQFDLNNIGEKFENRDVVKRLDFILDYLDSTDQGETYLPVILSETISEYSYQKSPKKKKEVIKATHISGIDNFQLNQLLGDMYLDVNIYDNYINLFNLAFISPAADNARSFYKFYLEDSTFIDSQWCFKLRFVPKRTGDLAFKGEMWIHDTTYAIKLVKASISESANINYIQNIYFEHKFDMVAPEVWMLTEERMIADVKLTQNSKLYGFFGRKYSSRSKFHINEPHPDGFYKTSDNVEILDDAKDKPDSFWVEHRPKPLSATEQGINDMVDSLNHTRFFKTLKNLTYFVSTGYYPLNKIEIGNAYNLVSFNPVEHFRTALALRTSNNFSRRIELSGKVAYGFYDERFKYGAGIRYNVTPKKRGMLTVFYNYDIEQIGQSPTAAAVGSTFGNVFRTGPLDKLTFVKKTGLNFEKDVKKDLILYGGFEWKEYKALGKANYVRQTAEGALDTISRIRTTEFTARIRWTKDEEFISGAFDRVSTGSKYPVFALQGIFGVKGLLGADYNYQKIEFTIDHSRNVGFLGRIRYGFNGGYIFGSAAYPFLKVHPGNQSYWLLTSAFNKLNYFEFVSDKYVGAYLEHHFQGLILDRVPLIKKLKWRLIAGGRTVYGDIDNRHTAEMLLPDFTKKFGKVPYAEANFGIENIFKVGRVDLVWRITHLDPGMNPLGIRARWTFIF